MEEIKTKAIILNTKDFNEADKIATIFSLDYGKITAKFTGVKRDKAKLKPLVQPFTFVDLECFKRADFYTVKTGAVIDSFAKILKDYNKMMCAYVVLDIINKILPKNKIEKDLFLLTINALKNIETLDCHQSLIEYIINFEKLLGEELNLFETDKRVYLDRFVGNFTEIPDENTVEIDKKVFNALSNPTDNINTKKTCLKLLNTILKLKYDVELNSFSFI